MIDIILGNRKINLEIFKTTHIVWNILLLFRTTNQDSLNFEVGRLLGGAARKWMGKVELAAVACSAATRRGV